MTNTPNDSEYIAAWLLDGQSIAFIRNTDNVRDIFVMNVDGSGQTNPTNTSGTFEDDLAWSPDGTKIVYCEACYPSCATGVVYVVNKDGSNRKNVTSLASTNQFL